MACAVAAWAGVATGQEPPAYTQPLGIALESCVYPHPVKYLALEIEGQPVRMAYMDVSPTAANGQTVLLLHGKNFYGNYWEGTTRALTAAGYRVVVPDQVGFGKSSKPDVHYSFDLLAANTVKLLDALGVQQVAVVGHSTGGMLAVRFARSYPERVTRLMLEDPIGLEDYRLQIPPQSVDTLYQAELANTDPAKIRAFFARYFAHPERVSFEGFVEVQTRVTLGAEYPLWAKASALMYEAIYQQPVRYEYRLLKPRTLLVVGAQDHTVPLRQYASPEVAATMGQFPELARTAAQEIPHGEVAVIEDCGHIPHWEQPERFHQILLDFLRIDTAKAEDQSPPKVPYWHVWTDDKGVSHQTRGELSQFELKSIEPPALPQWLDRLKAEGGNDHRRRQASRLAGRVARKPQAAVDYPALRALVRGDHGRQTCRDEPGEISFGEDLNTQPDAQGHQSHFSGTVGTEAVRVDDRAAQGAAGHQSASPFQIM